MANGPRDFSTQDSDESIKEEFEQIWNRGNEPDLKSFLNSKSIHKNLFLELLLIDFQHRTKTSGSPELDANDSNEIIQYYQRQLPHRSAWINEFASLIESQQDEFDTANALLQTHSGDRSRSTEHEDDDSFDLDSFDSQKFNLPEIDGFTVIRRLGAGGMGVVYLARHQALNRIVALKLIKNPADIGEVQLKRFRAEAQAAARLQHPNIISIFEVGQHENSQFFVMEYVEGPTLSQYLNNQPLDESRIALLCSKIANAIHYAHQQGVIHRDIKPSNILIDSNNEPHIADFGLAKLLDSEEDITKTGAAIGTPAYMPPEQAKGDTTAIAETSDVYSIGAIIYLMLVGRPPFHASTLVETLNQVLHDEPVAPKRINKAVSADLQTICLKCIEKEPSKRYSSANELAEELQRILDRRPILARPINPVQRFVRMCKRNPGTVTALSIIFLTLVIGMATSGYFAVQASERAKLATENLDRVETLLYDANMPTAQRWISDGLNTVAIDILKECRPDLADWEYHFLENAAKQIIYEGPGLKIVQAANAPSLAMGSNGKIQIWNNESRTFTKEIEIEGGIHGCGISADGKILAYITGDFESNQQYLQIIDLTSDKKLFRMETAAEHFRSIKFSPSGRYVSFTQDKSLIQVDLNINESKILIDQLPTNINDIEFAGSDDRLLIAEDTKLYQWTRSSEERSVIYDGHKKHIVTARYNPDNNSVVTTSWESMVVANLDDPQKRVTIESPTQTISADWLDNGTIIVACGDQSVRVWNVESNLMTAKLLGHNAPVLNVAVSRKYRTVASIQMMLMVANVGIKVWDIDSLQNNIQLTAALPGKRVNTFAISPDSRLIAFLTDDGGNQIDGEFVYEANAVELWQLKPLRRIRRIPVDADFPTGALQFTDDGNLRWYDKKNLVVDFNLASMQISNKFPVDFDYRTVQFSPSGKLVCESLGGRWLKIWNVKTGNKIYESTLENNEVIGDKTYIDSESKLVCGMLDGSVWIIDLETGEQSSHQLHGTATTATAVSPDESLLATSAGRTIKLWSMKDMSLIKEFVGHGNVIRTISISQNQNRLVSGSDDGTVRLWNIKSGRELLRFQEFGNRAQQVQFAPDGKTILAASNELLKVYRIE